MAHEESRGPSAVLLELRRAAARAPARHLPRLRHQSLARRQGAREHPADAAMREVREETGLPVRVTGLLGMWIDTYAPDGPNADKVTLNIYFHAEPLGPADAHADPSEVAEVVWFAPDELPDSFAFPGHLPAVLRARRGGLGGGRR